MFSRLFVSALLLGPVFGYDQVLGFNGKVEIETRTLDEIYEAAKKEGSVVNVWHGGDEKGRQDGLKRAFETRFPGITLNITVDLSKYHDTRIDQQLAAGSDAVYVDSVILQTLHDYPRWAQQGALLNYAPAGFEHIEPAFKDNLAAWYGVYVYSWASALNTDKLGDIEVPIEWEDWIKPEFKDKLAITYPHDDDAILFAFYLIMQQYGESWFDSLLELNPRWVRGSRTPAILTADNTTSIAAYIAGSGGFVNTDTIKYSHPVKGKYVSWPQTAAILKDAPNKEGAKLLHNFILSHEFQGQGMWSVRHDVATPAGLPDLWNETATNPTEFARFMSDRETVERLKLYFESKIGTAQGISSLEDDI